MDPSLVPFDTFQTLINHGFKTFSRNDALQNKAYVHLKQNAQLMFKYVQESNHEAFPMVSELWIEINSSNFICEFGTSYKIRKIVFLKKHIDT